MRPVDVRKKIDYALAEYAYQLSKGAKYADSFNPYDDTNKVRKERFKRFYEKLLWRA